MRFDIITIFPQIFDSYFQEGVLGRARKSGLIEIRTHNLRQWTDDRRQSVDDSPYGGGPGMVMTVEPIFRAVNDLKCKAESNARVILFSAKGRRFTQADARRLTEYEKIIMICGRYEGVDERVAEYIADEESSVGDFVLTGGEIPAMIVVDAVSRLLPGALGKETSLVEESFSGAAAGKNFLEYPQYTRPEEFNGWKVPETLLGGDHKKIAAWRKKMSNCEV